MPVTVITGGAGFVGSHLCDRFLAEGHEVIAVDNLITGRAQNVAHLARDSRFDLLLRDVGQPLKIPGQVDTVLHFASPASPKDFDALQCEILSANADGTRNGLELARAKGATFLLASTSEVYGDPEVHPQPETYRGSVDTLTVRGVYDESKRFAEAATMAWRRTHNVDTRIVRIFNTYGPRMRLDDGRVLTNFLTQALQGLPLTVYGDGKQTRSFCYVDDLVEGIWRLVHTPVHTPMNIGNPEEVTIADVAREVLALVGSDAGLVHLALPKGDPKLRRPDIRIAQRELDWSPSVDRDDGFRSMLNDIQARLESDLSKIQKAA
ncbi:MAG: NAD-dependent epimerase/dehydratase family protein [Myxococcota bacterium]